MEDLKLKPCPFCGDKVKRTIGFMGFYFFKCKNKECGATVSFDNDYCNEHTAEAIEAWNRRADYDTKQSN